MIEHLKGLPVQIEHTSFRLTDDEISIITNNEYYKPKSNNLTKTSFLLKDTRLSRVKNFLDEHMNNFIENVIEIKNKFVMTQSWATVNDKGNSHHQHNHPNTILSCVYYARASSGDFVIKTPNSRLQEGFFFSYERKEPNIFNTRATDIKVKTGDIVIFPGWVDHQSLPNKSDDERIIIGTNYFAMGQLGKHENKDYIEIG